MAGPKLGLLSMSNLQGLCSANEPCWRPALQGRQQIKLAAGLQVEVNHGHKSVNKKYRVAVVGNLQALNVLAPAFHTVPEFEVAALCGHNEAAIHAVAARLGISKCYRDWELLLNEPEIDVVALALPAAAQAEAAVKLAKAGKRLFCEKPLAADLAGAEAICQAVADKQVAATVNFGFRMIEAFRDFQAIARSGLLGPPQLVAVEWLLASRRDPTLTWNWKSDAGQGGGTLNLMVSHVLDYLAWCFGDVVKVRFQPATLVPFRPDAETGQPKKVLADDTCNLLMTLAPEIPVNVTVSTTVAVAQGHRMRAWFENGLLELANGPGDDYQDGFKITFYPAKNARSELEAEVKSSARFSKTGPSHPGKVEVTSRMIGQFALALAGRENLAPTLNDALKVQKWMELARQSGWAQSNVLPG